MTTAESLASGSAGTMSFRSSRRPSEDYIDTYITVPPDGGWGWVVVFCSFVSNFVVDGVFYTFGIFLNDISQTFNSKPTNVAVANSIMIGICMCSGPIVCALVNRLGFQLTGLIGGLVAGAGFMLSTLTTSVSSFLVVYGLIGGFGFGLVFLPSIVVIGFYFERWRALATSLAVTGSATGIMGFPLLLNLFLPQASWQLKFRVIAALCVIIGSLSLLYLPLKPTRVLTNKDKKIVQFLTSFNQEEKPGIFQKIYDRFHNVKYPTQAQLVKDSTFLMYHMPGTSTSSVFICSIPEESVTTFVNPDGRSEKLSTVYELEAFPTVSKRLISWKTCLQCKCWSRRKTRNRPMYRDDIFYGGSLFTIPGFSQSRASQMLSKKSTDYTLSVTRVEFIKEKEKMYLKCCPESMIRTLVTMLHFQLLKSPAFLLLAISGICTMLGMYVPYIYLIERANEINISREVSIYFYTSVGLSNAVGRIASGIISSIPRAKPLMISYVSLLVCGISTLISYFLKDFISHIVYTSVFGLTIACFATLRTLIVVELLGIENLTNAVGLLLLFHGLAASAGVPLAGQIVTVTKSFNKSFLFSGSMITFSAILLIPVKRVSKWTQKT